MSFVESTDMNIVRLSTRDLVTFAFAAGALSYCSLDEAHLSNSHHALKQP